MTLNIFCYLKRSYFCHFMIPDKYISSTKFVFNKWSKKGYAVFASLGKEIKIGFLKIEFFFISGLHSSPQLLLRSVPDQTEEESENREVVEVNVPAQLLALILPLASLSQIEGCECFSLDIHHPYSSVKPACIYHTSSVDYFYSTPICSIIHFIKSLVGKIRYSGISFFYKKNAENDIHRKD